VPLLFDFPKVVKPPTIGSKTLSRTMKLDRSFTALAKFAPAAE
jgi:hypothetical protein